MTQIRHRLHSIMPSWLFISAAVFVSIIFIIAVASLSFSELYRGKVMPGVSVAGRSLGGKTPAEAYKIISDSIAYIEEKGVNVSFKNHSVLVPSPRVALSPDAAPNLVSFNAEQTTQNALMIGRGKDWFSSFSDQVTSALFKRPVEISLDADQQGLLVLLQKEFSDFHKEAKNATVIFENNEPVIVAEESGQLLNYEKAVIALLDHLRNANLEEVTIDSQSAQPTISEDEARSALAALDSFLDFPDTKLVYEKNQWKLNSRLARGWIGFSEDQGQIQIVLDQEKIKDYLTKEVSPKINREARDAKLTINDGRVSIWQAGVDGLEIDLELTADKISSWPIEKPESIEVSIKEVKSASADANAEELGLKEIIGTGVSQFAGSPANRRHNIKVGANSLNGLLIKPGEEFSLLKALGPIDGKHGYLQELVIKDNKTIPEYGGGLCQIGTTMFRATFNSGLPVTQRRNHSYRVVYYEPAGTDATIYDPAPDYRFRNDTGHHILIQARMEGSQLAFDFWGTKDGRDVKFTKPVVYNIVSPGPTKIIETTTLKEGEKKCTEKAHNGADAYFDYSVTYPDGTEKKQRFSSHYVPWQAVCLVGAKKTPDGTTPPPPSSTITPAATPQVTP